MTPYHYYTASGATLAALIADPAAERPAGRAWAPRLRRPPTAQTPSYAPTLDPDTGLQLPSLSVAPDAAWTRMLVWSRPNLRQGTYYVNANPVALICANGSVLLSLFDDGAIR